jgi:L-fuculose-phosphate aldolase
MIMDTKMMNMPSYTEIRAEMCDIAAMLWARRLTNAQGGNLCVRTGENTLLITPTRMSEDKHCQLVPGDLLRIDFDANILEGGGGLSRETDMHIALLKAFPAVGAVIHAHPMNCMVFAAAGRPIPTVTEATEERGDAGLIAFAPACTPEMSANTLAYFEARRELAESGPLAAVLPKHGIVVTAPSLKAAFAYVEMLETDAYCALHMHSFPAETLG